MCDLLFYFAVILFADLGECLDSCVDIFFCIEVAEAETDGSCRVGAESLVSVWCAVQSDSGLYAVFEVEPECSICTVNAECLYGYDAGTSLNPFKSDYLYLPGFFERNDTIEESLCKT